LVNLPGLDGYGPTATFTGDDGFPYTLISSIKVAGTANVFQHPVDRDIYPSCFEWITVYVNCPGQ
jgi:hypothetical protein